MFSFRYARWIIVSSVIPTLLAAQKTAVKPVIGAASLKERHAFEILLNTVEESVVSAAEAMPADKYGFAPRDGEFTGVRTFSRQVKHLAATNHILAAAALGQDAPADAGTRWAPTHWSRNQISSSTSRVHSLRFIRRSAPSATIALV